MWAVWVLLLWQADYYGQCGRCGWPPVQLVARPCLVRRLLVGGGQGWVTRVADCRAPEDPGATAGPLVSGAGSQGSWMRGLRYLRAGFGLLVGRAGAQRVPELVPAADVWT